MLKSGGSLSCIRLIAKLCVVKDFPPCHVNRNFWEGISSSLASIRDHLYVQVDTIAGGEEELKVP